MELLCTKSPYDIDLPLDTTLTIEGKTVEVLGLAKTEEKDGFILQWWIIEEN